MTEIVVSIVWNKESLPIVKKGPQRHDRLHSFATGIVVTDWNTEARPIVVAVKQPARANREKVGVVIPWPASRGGSLCLTIGQMKITLVANRENETSLRFSEMYLEQSFVDFNLGLVSQS